jgi:hypothetical protein
MLNNLFGPIGYVFKNDMASKNIFHIAKVEKNVKEKNEIRFIPLIKYLGDLLTKDLVRKAQTVR